MALPTPDLREADSGSRLRKEAALAPFGLAAIDEIMKPFHGPEAETVRCATRIAHTLNMGEEPDDDVVALLTVLYCTPSYDAALLPFEVERHLRQAVKPCAYTLELFGN